MTDMTAERVPSRAQQESALVPHVPYIVLSTLFLPVASVEEVPSDAPLYRRRPDTQQLEPFERNQVTQSQLATAVSQGRVFAAWGQKLTELQELDNWAGSCLKR